MPNSSATIAPFGSWKSPISSAMACQASKRFQMLQCDPLNKEIVYWSELDPDKKGAVFVYSRSLKDSDNKQWTPEGFSCRSRVHEYGGGAFFVHDGLLFFVNDSDQQIYKQSAPNDAPTLVTPGTKGYRYADGQAFPSKDMLVCICEDHTVVQEKGSPDNFITLINIAEHSQTVLVSGADFYSWPRISPDGSKLLWMEWNHPNMPWDDTKIVVASVSGQKIDVASIRYVCNTPGINAQHPRWGSDGCVFYINDETDWWNIYSWDQQSEKSTNLCPKDFDFGFPQWQFGHSSYDVHPSGNQIVAKWEKSIILIDVPSGKQREIPVGDYIIGSILFCPGGSHIFAIAHDPTAPSEIISVNIETGQISTLSSSSALPIDKGYLSRPGRVSFPTVDGAFAHGIYYPPMNKDFRSSNGGSPPLLVKVHGGPTSQASLVLDLSKQYFTSRGFAIFDVDYRGSTGYGRKYRQALFSNWGKYDIEDCCSGALYLAKELRLVNPDALFIDGGSAGGYTTLACLTFRDTFKAGASHFGISDLELLTKETHKFESRYCDKLIAPWDEEHKNIYIERSPLYHIDKLNVPAAFFHGALDKVVLPNQAKMMYDAIKARKLPCAYVLFPDEFHGFVRSENKQKALDGEFYFLTRILGVKPADEGIEIPIENLKD